jgi:hypothetical protein
MVCMEMVSAWHGAGSIAEHALLSALLPVPQAGMEGVDKEYVKKVGWGDGWLVCHPRGTVEVTRTCKYPHAECAMELCRCASDNTNT